MIECNQSKRIFLFCQYLIQWIWIWFLWSTNIKIYFLVIDRTFDSFFFSSEFNFSRFSLWIDSIIGRYHFTGWIRSGKSWKLVILTMRSFRWVSTRNSTVLFLHLFLIDDFHLQSPYDSFMKKHLQHYGYFCGTSFDHVFSLRFRNIFSGRSETVKKYGFLPSRSKASSSSDDSDSNSSDDENDRKTKSRLDFSFSRDRHKRILLFLFSRWKTRWFCSSRKRFSFNTRWVCSDYRKRMFIDFQIDFVH